MSNQNENPVLFVVRDLNQSGYPAGDSVAFCTTEEKAREIAAKLKGDIIISLMYTNTPFLGMYPHPGRYHSHIRL